MPNVLEGGNTPESMGSLAARIGTNLNEVSAFLTANAETIDPAVLAERKAAVDDIHARWTQAVENNDMETLRTLEAEVKALPRS